MNKAEKLRISRPGWYGSLWCEYRKKSNLYRFLVTGHVNNILTSKLENEFGKFYLESRNYKCWHISRTQLPKFLELYAQTN